MSSLIPKLPEPRDDDYEALGANDSGTAIFEPTA